jgi:hypothetical protein
VIAEHGDQSAAVILYAVAVGTLSLLQLWIWVHAHRAGLMSAEVDDGIYRLVRRNLLPVPIVFLGSIPFAAVFGAWVSLAWFLLLPVSVLFARLPLRERATPSTPRRSRDSAS